MSCSLPEIEITAQGLCRTLRGQLHLARACLADDGRLTGTDIHSARKAIRRSRATLRLLRPAIGDSRFSRANRSLRDMSRTLMVVRDARALLDTLDCLGEIDDCAADDMAAELRRSLVRNHRRSRRGLSGSSPRVSRLRRGLEREEARVAAWPIPRDGWGLLRPAILSIYRKARVAGAEAVRDRSLEALHEWRKRVKDLWHSLQVLAPPEAGKEIGLARLAHRIADDLGADRDLALLMQYARSVDPPIELRSSFERLIERERKKLQRRAFATRRRLFRHGPRRMVRKLEQKWAGQPGRL